MLTLLLDIGGTILKRSKPGPKQRVINILKKYTNISQQDSLTAADIILTSKSREHALSRLSNHYNLSRKTLEYIKDTLHEQEGNVRLIPRALDLIMACKRKKIKLIYTTNAVAWAPKLPEEFMSGASYFSSSSIGIPKRDIKFWKKVLELYELDPGTCLSIGDSLENDINPAQESGIAAVHIDNKKINLEVILNIINSIEKAPVMQDGFIAGTINRITDHYTVDCSHLADWVTNKTRSRVVLSFNKKRTRGEVIRMPDSRSILFVTKTELTDTIFGWIKFERDRRITNIPLHIEEKIAAHGKTFDGMVEHEKRHYVSLLIEATSETVLEERLKIIIDLLPIDKNLSAKR